MVLFIAKMPSGSTSKNMEKEGGKEVNGTGSGKPRSLLDAFPLTL